MLARKITRVEEDTTTIIPPPAKFEQWNDQLGKKFSAMYKVYQKFCLKHKSQVLSDPDTAKDTDDVETDVMQNLVKHAESERYLKKFYNEFSATFKTENLQLIQLFECKLNGQDPFYIECDSPAINQKAEVQTKRSKNIYQESNFINSEALDDIETLEEIAFR